LTVQLIAKLQMS